MVDRETSVSVLFSETYNEILSLTDDYSRVWLATPEYTDTLNLTDTLIRSPILKDTLTLSDTLETKYDAKGDIPLYAQFKKTLSDTLTLADTISRGKVFTETLNLTDTLIRSPILNETLNLTDEVTSNFVNLFETISLSDGDERETNVLLTEVLTLTDSYSRDWVTSKNLSETLVLASDKIASRNFLETFSLADTLIVSPFLTEILSLTDSLTTKHDTAGAIPLYANFRKILSETLTLTDELRSGFTFYGNLTLSDTYNRVWQATKELTETLTLGDEDNFWSKELTEILTISDGESRDWDHFITLEETLILEVPTLGSDDESSLYIKNGSGNWIAYNDYEFFKIVKKQNQVSEFEIFIPNIETSDKVFVKEFAEVIFLSGNDLILKGRIQKITYETAYTCNISGFGMEVVLLDKEFEQLSNTTAEWSDSKRAQYTNASAQTIANELLSADSDGAASWIMQPNTGGIFDTDYGNVSMRFEYANRLKSLSTLCESLMNPTYQLPYEWWVSQSSSSGVVFGNNFNEDYFNVAPLGPSITRATFSQETFTITGSTANAVGTFNEKDITNLSNKITILGYGDGINQISTTTYNASETYSSLGGDITAVATTITLADASGFASSGTIRIAEEIITYSGKSTNDLTGCTRATSSTTARVHQKGVYVEKYIAVASAEAGSSIGTNGLMDYSITDRELLDIPTAELVASKLLFERMDPIVFIRVVPDEPLQTAGNRQIGDLVTVTDSESAISGDYRIVGITYTSDYGYLGMELELSNKTLNFIEQMSSTKAQADRISKYMQGSTNIYAINEAENCDSSHPLHLRFYLPPEAIAINQVLLSFKLKGYRYYTTTSSGGSSHNHDVSIGYSGSHQHTLAYCTSAWPTSGFPLSAGVGSTLAGGSHTHGAFTSTSESAHTHAMVPSITESSLTSPSVTVKVGPDGGSLTTIGTYGTDQENLDISSAVEAVGAGNWIDIEFNADKNMRIEANAYIQIFIRSRV